MREWGTRLLVYVIGLLVLAGGSTLAINVKLGLSAVNCFPYVLGRALDVSYGTGLIIVFVFFIGLQYLLLGSKFHISNLLQFPVTFLYGYFADFWVWTFGAFEPETYAAKVVMLLCSIAVVGFGVALYVTPNIMPNPVEGLSMATAERFGKTFSAAKTITDSSAVVAAGLTGLVFLGAVVGVREGTIVSALLTGRAAGYCFRITRPLAARLAGIDHFLHKR
jgi:uncharacterized membrane protein YczE